MHTYYLTQRHTTTAKQNLISKAILMIKAECYFWLTVLSAEMAQVNTGDRCQPATDLVVHINIAPEAGSGVHGAVCGRVGAACRL